MEIGGDLISSAHQAKGKKARFMIHTEGIGKTLKMAGG
jgi:hypothetical protein